MPEEILRDLPYPGLKCAEIDAPQRQVLLTYIDETGTERSEALPLEAHEILCLNRGGTLVLRCKAGKAISLRV